MKVQTSARREARVGWGPFLVAPGWRHQGRYTSWLVEMSAEGWGLPVDRSDIVNSWSLDLVFEQLYLSALEWHQAEDARHRQPLLSADDIRRWSRSTRIVAGAFGVPRALGAQVLKLVDLVEEARRRAYAPWGELKRFPSPGTQKYAALRCSCHLWALDQLFRAWNEVETSFRGRSPVEHDDFWKYLFDQRSAENIIGLKRAGFRVLPIHDRSTAHKRIDRFATNIRNGSESSLTARILRDTVSQIVKCDDHRAQHPATH